MNPLSGTLITLLLVSNVTLLLLLILKCKINPFIALLMVSITTGLSVECHPWSTRQCTKRDGQHSGLYRNHYWFGSNLWWDPAGIRGALTLAKFLIDKFGISKAPISLMFVGFLISIPVFFDVGFIILAPIVYELARQTKNQHCFTLFPCWLDWQ